MAKRPIPARLAADVVASSHTRGWLATQGCIRDQGRTVRRHQFRGTGHALLCAPTRDNFAASIIITNAAKQPTVRAAERCDMARAGQSSWADLIRILFCDAILPPWKGPALLGATMMAPAQLKWTGRKARHHRLPRRDQSYRKPMFRKTSSHWMDVNHRSAHP